MNKRAKFLLVIVFSLFLILPLVSAEWWNEDWSSKKEITITEKSGHDLYNYSVYLVVQKRSNMNETGKDLRFVDADESEELNYWIEKYNTTTFEVWVYMPKMFADVNTAIYMYYGNQNATSESNYKETFLVADDFEDGVLDTDIWETNSLAMNNPIWNESVTSGELYLEGTATRNYNNQYTYLRSKKTIPSNLHQGMYLYWNISYVATNNIALGHTTSYFGFFNSSTRGLIGGGTTQDSGVLPYYRLIKGLAPDSELYTDDNMMGTAIGYNGGYGPGPYGSETDCYMYTNFSFGNMSCLNATGERISGSVNGIATKGYIVAIDTGIYIRQAGAIGNVSIRDIRVRSFVSPEPTITFGPEQVFESTPPWTKITNGAATIIKNFNKKMGIKQIQIAVNNKAQNVSINVLKQNKKPANVSIEKARNK